MGDSTQINWFTKNWQMIAWIIGLLGTGFVFAEGEYRQYVTMQEAVKEQKEFNVTVGEQVRDMEMRQERMDTNIEFMKDMLKRIDERVK